MYNIKNEGNELSQLNQTKKFTKEQHQHHFSWALSRWRHHLDCWAGNQWTWQPGCHPRTGTQVHIKHQFISRGHFEIMVTKCVKWLTTGDQPEPLWWTCARVNSVMARVIFKIDGWKFWNLFVLTLPVVLRSGGQVREQVNSKSLPLPKLSKYTVQKTDEENIPKLVPFTVELYQMLM